MKETMNPTESKSDAFEPSDKVVARANELYWHSEESVNQLARELDLSKGTLYEILLPLPADLPCPRDDCELSYPNRTARDRGFVSCTTCGFEDEEDQIRALLELQEDLDATELGAPDAGASSPGARAATVPGKTPPPDPAPLSDGPLYDDVPATRRPSSSRDPAPHGAAPLRSYPSRPRRLETLVVVSVLTGLTAGLILGGLFRRR